MRFSNSYVPPFRNIKLAVCLLFCALGSAQAQTTDGNKMWTTVGSTGTLDKNDVSKVSLGHSIVQIGIALICPSHKIFPFFLRLPNQRWFDTM
jgi:hypothetical protein